MHHYIENWSFYYFVVERNTVMRGIREGKRINWLTKE